jgi:hypothetical protein
LANSVTTNFTRRTLLIAASRLIGCIWQDIIKQVFTETPRSSEHSNEPWDCIKSGSIDRLRKYKLFKGVGDSYFVNKAPQDASSERSARLVYSDLFDYDLLTQLLHTSVLLIKSITH